jgi:hypothetical protein
MLLRESAGAITSSMPSPRIVSQDHPVRSLSLDHLSFDLHNPRYGTGASSITSEREALNHIVSNFGVNDVLSSLAVNGFFASEPLVGLETKGNKKIRILEGNRRLAACLILLGDERAKDQAGLTEKYTALYKRNGKKPVSPVPVIVYDAKKESAALLPYIGVRHIVGFLEWDSYAKAAWVDTVLKDHDLTLSEVVEMIGDKNRTIPRMLAGYRFVRQLVKSGHFRPEQSQRKGRGSNADYPFSWVYSALDNPPIKEFVGFKEKAGTPIENPIPNNKLEDAGLLMTFMFGDKTQGKAAVVEDSRELGELAKVILDPSLRSKLKDGKKIRVVIDEARPSEARLAEGLQRVADQLKDMSGLAVPGALDAKAAFGLIDPAHLVVNLSRKLLSDLRNISVGETSGDGD